MWVVKRRKYSAPFVIIICVSQYLAEKCRRCWLPIGFLWDGTYTFGKCTLKFICISFDKYNAFAWLCFVWQWNWYCSLLIFCRKFELYPISFQHEISSNNLLVAAPYGGSIAVTRNPKKFVKVQGASKPLILLYTSSGKLTAKLQVRSL